MTKVNITHINQIIAAGISAPSADNTQPWRVRVDNDVIFLHLIPERDIAPYDSVPNGSYMALGAFIENMDLAARYFGYIPHVHYEDPSADNMWLAAKMILEISELENSLGAKKLFEAIEKRVTNRKPYEKKVISADKKNELASLIGNASHRVVVLDYPQREYAKAISITERIVFQNQEVHKGTFKMIRWSDEDVLRTRDGFSITTFELSFPARIIFNIARKWSRLEKLNAWVGLAKLLPSQTCKLYEQSGAFIGIIGKAAIPKDFMEAGRVMQRVWLAATSLGLSVQPLAGLLFFKLGIDNHTTSVFSDEEIALIEKSYAEVASVFGTTSGENVVCTLRVGTGSEPSSRTIRRSIIEVLEKK